MPDAHPITPHEQAATKPGISPSSTLSSDYSLSSSSSSKPDHRRFLSLDSLEATSTKILGQIRARSRSPHPQTTAPTASNDRQKRRSLPPSAPHFSAVPQSASPSFPPPSSPTPPVDRDFSSPSSDMSPTADHHAQRPSIGQTRTSDISAGPMEPSERTRSNSYKRYSGTINHYGRHSNDWLFGGFSVRDTLRDGIEKLKGHNSERDS